MGEGNIMENQEGNKEIRILVAVPRAGFTVVEAVDNQWDMAMFLGRLSVNSPFKFYSATIGRLFVAKAREEFAKYAIQMECEYLFMIDDDMICPPDLFLQLYNRIQEKPEIDVLAPLAFQRRPPYYPVVYMQRDGWDPIRKETYFANEIVKNYPKDKLFECDAVGFGAVLIKVSILKKMLEPRFMSTSPSGEDILFCYNARAVGARVFVDTSIKIAHLGAPEIVTEETYEKHNNMEQAREYYGECAEKTLDKKNESDNSNHSNL